jgi:hypothetical protein
MAFFTLWFVSAFASVLVLEMERQLCFRKNKGRFTQLVQKIGSTVLNTVSIVGSKVKQAVSSTFNKISGGFSRLKGKFSKTKVK